MNRLVGLDGTAFDAIVIGGGIAGGGVARDLALRGLSVALFEKQDFAAGTSSKSSKLIHGGLRYLELGDLALVRESLREKKRLERMAPHLLRPLPFLVPVYQGARRGLITVRIGLWLYDLLTPGKRTERFRVLRSRAARELEPALRPDELRGVGYYVDDLLLLPERLCLENVFSAVRHGARAYNYCEVQQLVRSTRGIEGACVRDLLTDRVHEVRAPVIVNAAGPWIDRVRERVGIQDAGARLLRPTKGIHCLLERITERAVYLPGADERMIFVIPWRQFSLVGTTDTDFDGDPDRLWATRGEVEYLLAAVREVLPDSRVALDRVVYTYAGVRPLSWEEGSASKVSREHRVVAEGEGGRFLSITGTKLTCFRGLAEEVGDRVTRLLGRSVRSRSSRLSLDGLDEEVGTFEARARLDVSEEMAASGLGPDTLETLVETYGRGYGRVLELARKFPDGLERLCPNNPELVGQLHHAVREEMAVTLQDVLLRRTGIGQSPCLGLDCAPQIARRMAEINGWSRRRRDAELEAYHGHVERSLRFRDGGGAGSGEVSTPVPPMDAPAPDASPRRVL
jgi:glycerol-3-phosphate dehydrogenase